MVHLVLSYFKLVIRHLLTSSTFCATAGVQWKTVRTKHFFLTQCSGRKTLVNTKIEDFYVENVSKSISVPDFRLPPRSS